MNAEMEMLRAQRMRELDMAHKRALADVCAMTAGALMVGALLDPDPKQSADRMARAMEWQMRGVLVSLDGARP